MNTDLNTTETTVNTTWSSYFTLANGQAVVQATAESIKKLDITNLEELGKITAVLTASTGISILSAVKISDNIFTLGQVSTGGKVIKAAKIGFWSAALAASSYISIHTAKVIYNQL